MNRHTGSIVNIVADMWNGMPMMGPQGGASWHGQLHADRRCGMGKLRGSRQCRCARLDRSSGMDTYDGSVKAMIPTLKKSVPLKRLGTEAEVSSVIAFLLSEASAFITGTTIRVDGAAPFGGNAFHFSTTINRKPIRVFIGQLRLTCLKRKSHDIRVSN